MSTNMTNKHESDIDSMPDEGDDLSLKEKGKGNRYRCKLKTMQDVRHEMAKVYREARSEIIDPAVASKLVWVLQAVSKVIEGSDLEKRVEILESKNELK